jgi:hypothetical protein
MKSKILLLVAFFSLVAVSCSKEDENANANATVSVNETVIDLQIDSAIDVISKTIDQQLSTEEGFASRDGFGSEDFSPPCAVVTRVPAFGIVLTPGTLVTKTINFGTVGCVMPNGNILKGQIIVSFTFSPLAPTQTVNYIFENFYINAIKFEGNRSFTRTLTAPTATSPAHPIVTMNMDMTVTFANGAVVQRTGTRIREIIEGFTTPIFSDNIFKITGNWTTTLPNATVKTSTITTPLIIRANCPNIVRGVITFVRNGNTATLDYGNGACDNQAVFTKNGIATTITLGN